MKKMIKTIVIVLATMLFYYCNSQNKEFTKVPEEQVDNALLEKAEKQGTQILENFKNGKYEALSEEEATNEVRKGLSPENQKQAHETIKQAFGEFVSMNYVETYSDGKYMIFRFRGKYTGDARPEVRVVMNNDGKLAGFFVLAWKNTLQNRKKRP